MSASGSPNGEIRKQTTLQTVAAFSTVAVALGAAMWSQFTKLNVLDASIIEIRQQNTRSIDERNQLMKEAEKSGERIAELQSMLSKEISERTEELREVETQVDSLSQSTNTAVAELHRMNSVAWSHIPELGPYPTAPFPFSNISNRNHSK